MHDAADQQADQLASEGDNRRDGGRVPVNIECEIRIGNRAWRKTQIADLTPGGFQVTIMEMPPRGTPVYVRFAGMQLQKAEVCWSDQSTTGCQFTNPLSPYVFDHIVAAAG